MAPEMDPLDTGNTPPSQAPGKPSDDLLAQLNGEDSVESSMIDPLPAGDPDLEKDPLQVNPDAPKSPVHKSNEKFSTAAGGKGYRVKVKGDYYAAPEKLHGRKQKKPYEAEFNLPHLDAAMSVIKHKLLKKFLLKKYDDFIAIRTHMIVSATPLSPDTPESKNLAYMNRDALVQHIKDISAPIDYAGYADTAMLRESVVDYTLNPKGFEKREKERLVKAQEDAELARMNPELNDPEDS